MAINRHFCHFRQIHHFCRNRHFAKGPFAISFEFLLTVWRFWRLSAISAIFVKYAIFAEIATFQRAPLPSHLNFCLRLAVLAINCHFCHFRQIRHFRRNRHFAKGPFAISFEFLFIVWGFWRLITISAIFAKYAIFAEIATFQRAPLPSHLYLFVYSLAILAINCHFCHFCRNRHFAKGPFTMSFEFLFIVWRFWRFIAISAIFANACISGHISIYSQSF